jgi:hypothetical protein
MCIRENLKSLPGWKAKFLLSKNSNFNFPAKEALKSR